MPNLKKIDTPGGKRNLKMRIKAQQMTFRQDITKYKIYWLTFRCIVHNIFRAINLFTSVYYIYTNHGRTGRKKLGGGKKFARLFRIVRETFQNCCRQGGGVITKNSY
jgi:hypothetical protein